MPLTTVTITGRYTRADGTPSTGEITFRLSETISNTGQTVQPAPLTFPLAQDGSFTATLVANDDPATIPVGTFYNVTERVDGMARDYSVTVSHTTPNVTLDSLLALQPPGNAQGATKRYTSYIDLQEAKTWLRYTTDSVVDPFDSNLQRIVDMACTWVQNRIARPAAPQTFVERHDGWSGEYIMLHEAPVVKINYCKEYQSSGGVITLPESTPENPVDGIQVDYATGRIMRTFAGYSWPRPFFPGSRNIEISYVAGLNPTPPDLVAATLELIGHWWRQTQQTYRIGGRGLAAEAESPNGLWVGVPFRIIDIVDMYRRVVVA